MTPTVLDLRNLCGPKTSFWESSRVWKGGEWTTSDVAKDMVAVAFELDHEANPKVCFRSRGQSARSASLSN